MSSNSESLLRLKKSLDGAQRNTKDMLTRLEHFEKRLSSLDEKMGPIRTTTTNYTRAQENIAAVVKEVQKTYEYFRIAKQVEGVISAGLSDQREFFHAIERLTNAKRFFEEHRTDIKSALQALKAVDGLLSKAINICADELERLLLSCGKSVEVVDGHYRAINPMSASTAKEVKAICDTLDSNKHVAHFEVYEGARIAQVRAELKALEQRNAAEWRSLLEDVPYQKGSHPLRDYSSLAYEMLKGEMQLWSATLPTSEASQLVFVAICDAIVSEMQRVLSPMLLEDHRSREKSGHINKQGKLFLIRLDMLDMFMVKFENMRDVCRPDLRHESTASIALTTMRNAMVEACIDSIGYLLMSSLDGADPDSISGAKTFAAITHSSKKTDKEGIEEPLTCDLHSITVNVIHCCKEVIKFTSVYRLAYDLAIDIGIKMPPYVPAPQDLITTLLENLLMSLQNKGDRLDPVGKTRQPRLLKVHTHALYEAGEKEAEDAIVWAKRHLFLANNLFSVYTYLREKRQDVQDELEQQGGSAGDGAASGVATRRQAAANHLRQIKILFETVEIRLMEEQNNFCETVTAGLCMTERDTHEFYAAYQDKMTNHERLLKAKFSMFNSGMDALIAQQGEWRISAAGLREQVRQQLLKSIMPPYAEFFNSFSTVQFSRKHMNQYIRFPPQEVERILWNFFGKN